MAPTFLLPFETKMLSVKKDPDDESEDSSEEKRKKLVLSCFLIVKVLVSKMLFKPYRIAQYFDLDIN